MRKFYVYQLRLETTEQPFYIGKGSGRRKSDHFRQSSLRAETHKNRVIRKAMREGVQVLCDILHENLTEKEAFSKEVELIAFYGRHNLGGCLTNATDGGEGGSGWKAPEETRKKMSEAKIGRKKPESVRAKMSASHKARTKTTEHVRNSKIGQWDRNPVWINAGIVYDTWIAAGKPGAKRLQKLLPDFDVRNVYRKFHAGWIPKEDPDWVFFLNRQQG